MEVTETVVRELTMDLPEDLYNQWESWIDGSEEPPNQKRATRIEERRATFGDGMQVDARIIAADPHPYLDVVLFGPNGHQVACGEPTATLSSEVMFDLDGKAYYVKFASHSPEPVAA